RDNPVDWYPWGPEALDLARTEQKPIFLSVGYSSCHWCHVMAHESFEDPETAAYLNEHFVNIKVDREERPDIDSIYMTSVQALTGHGGWPMSVFLTPEQVPYYGGTYWPPQTRQGMPSFRQVLEAVADAWENKRGEVEENAQNVRNFLEAASTRVPKAGELTDGVLDGALAAFGESFDRTYGGFGNAPKFPQPSIIEFLLRFIRRRNDSRAIRMVELTLDRMAQGGLYDQLGGGFHRYSVDAQWLVPHFEKMLYDNA
ncbi:MAG: thioredoxin domain-containing protein, partial [Thermomicrobiales bacterium]|nr:thioredoxin domain-containing protein [Thermomicrobiales bacterium]